MLVALFSAASAQETVTREENTNRFGSDYRAFDLQQALSDTGRLHGRGLALIQHNMDEVTWNGNGNAIRMVRYVPSDER